jgi:molecular chaperone DnaK
MSLIGIDLGTNHSTISKWISNNKGNGYGMVYHLLTENSKSLASKLFVDKNDEGELNFVVGRLAIKKGILYPDKYVTAIKREMDANTPREIEGVNLTPVELSAEILKMLLRQAENVEGPGTWIPEGIVVTVPYYFKQPQNINTSEAVKKAINDLFGERAQKKGINIDDIFLSLVPGPIAVALDNYSAISVDQQIANETFLLFDLGGTTLDLTIFETKVLNNNLEFEILGNVQDFHLGGEVFDSSLMTYVLQEAWIDFTGYSEKNRRHSYYRIKKEITYCKELLTSSESTELLIPMAMVAAAQPGRRNIIDIDLELTRSDFEKCLNGEAGNRMNYLGKIKYELDRLFHETTICRNDITSVLLAGGSSQIPIIKELLQQYFSIEKVKDIPNDPLVAGRGASAYAAYLLDQKRDGNYKRLSKWKSIKIK